MIRPCRRCNVQPLTNTLPPRKLSKVKERYVFWENICNTLVRETLRRKQMKAATDRQQADVLRKTENNRPIWQIKETTRTEEPPSSQLSGTFNLWLHLCPDPQTAVLLVMFLLYQLVLMTGWSRWNRSYLLLECYFHVSSACSVISGSVFLFCWHLKCATCLPRRIDPVPVCLWPLHFKMDKWEQRVGRKETEKQRQESLKLCCLKMLLYAWFTISNSKPLVSILLY